MRVLGIETSSVRGSVALINDRESVCALSHERENSHGASILPLVERALAEAGWSRSQLDRVAVGTGPGSFTGLRVGIALAQGLSEGLERPLIGVPSLRAMALAVASEWPGPRCVLLDARRGELFVAIYGRDGSELVPVQVIAGGVDLTRLTHGLPPVVFLGNGAALMPDLAPLVRGPETDLPHARWSALAALDADPAVTARPLYVRDAVAVLPALPDNPLRSPR